MKTRKINVITLGCSKNTVDSEFLLKNLESQGFTVLHDSDFYPVDTVIINTCGFISDAREESINTILKYTVEKQKGHVKKIFVTGCLSQKYMSVLKEQIPEVDFYTGVNSINEILEKLCHGEKVKLFNDRIITGPGHYAYLKISEGCDRTCAFCSIPGIRGKYVSKSVEEIINEAGNLAEKGIKELILIAQVLNYYGADLYGRRMLTHLIYKILERNYFEWIRLQYLYPEGIFESLLDIIRTSKQVCKYIDIPIQHISSRMLKLMKRSYSRYRVEKLLNTIRDKIPEAAIRTAIIVGHPGESKKDFEELKDFISGFQFDRLGVFKYSHEEGTYSYKNYSDSIPQKEKEARASELMEIQQDISLKLNTLKINKVFKTIIDRREGGYYTGRTEFDSPEVDNEVLIENRFNLKPGLFYNIRIIDAREFDLFGVPEF